LCVTHWSPRVRPATETLGGELEEDEEEELKFYEQLQVICGPRTNDSVLYTS
jgi:hypothetical protein